MEVQFVASVSAIVGDAEAARRLFLNGLGITFEGGEGDYIFTERLEGVKHFGLWPLREAAIACFGGPDWPGHLPVPHASIEFEVPDVEAAEKELVGEGYQLLHGAKVEPWGQTTARVLTGDGLLVAVCYTPWFHESQGTVPA